MVDREARDGYAELLRHFAAGRVVNFAYDDATDAFASSRDPAVRLIWGRVWPVYCDLREHALDGNDCLDAAGRRIIARYILFLHSQREYEWPEPGIWRMLLNVATLGIWNLVSPLSSNLGDEAVWPFFRRCDLEAEAAKPRLLAGSR